MHRGEHTYSARLVWKGAGAEGTSSYASYGRDFAVEIEGKPELRGSANAAFRGDARRHDPEDLFLASIAACHMLFYLSLCARRGVRVLDYRDAATGRLVLEEDGGGRFAEVELRPSVRVADAEQVEVAASLHDEAHELCFIARSCGMPILVAPTVTSVAGGVPGATELETFETPAPLDLAIELANRPGALAELGEALGRAGVSIEGGGAFAVDGRGIAHFLVADGAAARDALNAAGIRLLDQREVVVQRLEQAEPGQLGKLTRRMADADVNIEVLYSDHEHRLILVVDDVEAGRGVAEAWTQEGRGRRAAAIAGSGRQVGVLDERLAAG